MDSLSNLPITLSNILMACALGLTICAARAAQLILTGRVQHSIAWIPWIIPALSLALAAVALIISLTI